MLLQQVAAALTQMHKKHLVHQDLHVGNVLLSLDGTTCKIADLGSARHSVINGEPNFQSTSLCVPVPLP